jgi:hypothetical protein
MKYYSEELQKTFDTEEECVAAEKEYLDTLEKAKQEGARLREEKASRAKAVQAAYEKYVEAEKDYKSLRNDFIKDYGYFHATYSTSEDLDNYDIKKLVDEIFDWHRIF